jgi:hypothetical protein
MMSKLPKEFVNKHLADEGVKRTIKVIDLLSLEKGNKNGSS